ncbi:unnamed protein product [Closterium sp. NIES-54]
MRRRLTTLCKTASLLSVRRGMPPGSTAPATPAPAPPAPVPPTPAPAPPAPEPPAPASPDFVGSPAPAPPTPPVPAAPVSRVRAPLGREVAVPPGTPAPAVTPAPPAPAAPASPAPVTPLRRRGRQTSHSRSCCRDSLGEAPSEPPDEVGF